MKKPSLMERRNVKPLMMSSPASMMEENVHPNEMLKKGDFDIDKSHLKVINGIKAETSSQEESESPEIINEQAIDAFLESEDIQLVDFSQY